jgi:hypothetical protein
MFRFLCLSLALYAFAGFQVKAADLQSCLANCDRQINNASQACTPGERSCNKSLTLRTNNCPKNCNDKYK